MTALFKHEMALAAMDPNPFNAFGDGEHHWMVLFFDRRGSYTGAIFGMRKSEAQSKAAKARRLARNTMKSTKERRVSNVTRS